MTRNNDTSAGLRVNSIIEGTKLKGELSSPGNFRVDGEVDGNIRIEGKLIIGAKGLVKGTVMCKDAEIEGSFEGRLTVSGLLSLKSTSVIKGDAEFDRLMVAEGAKLYCTCNLKSKTSTAPVPPTMKKPADAVLVDKEPSISSLG